MPKAYADIPEGQVSYRTDGSGEPLLLLHMVPMCYEEYSEMIPILAKRYRVVAMDMLGYGYSDDPPREYEIEDHAQSVVSFLSAIGISKTSVVGHGLGALIAVEIAAAYPERVDKLILSSCSSWGPERWKQWFSETKPGFSCPYPFRQPADDGLFLTDWWQANRQFAPYAKPELFVRPTAMNIMALHRPYDGHWLFTRYDSRPRLPLIKSPTLLVSGTFFLDQLEATKSLIPRCKTQVIECGGVLICFEKPDEFAQAILDFMKNPGV